MFLFVPGRSVFFTEIFKEDEDGVLQWVSDGGAAVFMPHLNRDKCSVPGLSAWYER